jgi:putative transposase
MPRKPRFVFPGIPLHVVQRGNNRRDCFFTDADRQVFLSMLSECAFVTNCAIHAYALMTNHIHLLLTPEQDTAASKLMQFLEQRYVQYVNRRHERVGTLWQGRFRSCVVEDERYFFTCQRYIELNPVRAGIVASPEQYKWSSFRTNALNEPSNVIKPHALYEELGHDIEQRSQAYRNLFDFDLPGETVDLLRTATNRNMVMNEHLFDEIFTVRTMQNL